MDSFHQPLSPRFVDHLDCTFLCPSISDSLPAVNEDQVVDGVGVMQPTCTIIHVTCVWESKEEPMVKDESLLAAPHPLYPDIPCDSATAYFACENTISKYFYFWLFTGHVRCNSVITVWRGHIFLQSSVQSVSVILENTEG